MHSKSVSSVVRSLWFFRCLMDSGPFFYMRWQLKAAKVSTGYGLGTPKVRANLKKRKKAQLITQNCVKCAEVQPPQSFLAVWPSVPHSNSKQYAASPNFTVYLWCRRIIFAEVMVMCIFCLDWKPVEVSKRLPSDFHGVQTFLVTCHVKIALVLNRLEHCLLGIIYAWLTRQA